MYSKFTLLFILPAIGIVILTDSCTQKNTTLLEDEVDSLSYYMGIYTGHMLKEADYTTLNSTSLYTAFDHARNNELKQADYNLADEVIDRYITKGRYTRNQRLGEEFMKANLENDDVKVTQSGIQYQVYQEGNEKRAQLGDSLTFYLKGSTIDGLVFMNLYEPKPHRMTLNSGTKGGIESLQMMGEGARYRFVIPTALAYGSDPPANGILKPYMPMVYEVEMVSIKQGTSTLNN